MTMQIVRKIVKKSTWLFKKVYEGHGSTDSKFHDKFGILSCVLEFIQNALDAIQKGKTQVFVKIKSVNVKFKTFEDTFLTKEYKNLFPFFDVTSPEVLTVEKDITCLVMEDFNTTGILGDPSVYKAKLPNGEQNSIHQFNNEVGGKRKVGDARKGGSEGEGRQTFCYSSDISSFFYYTLREDGSDYFMGINFCGTFDHFGNTYQPFSHFGNIVESQEKFGIDFAVPINDPEEINKLKSVFKIDRKEAGTTIIIPYINKRVTFPKIQETICTRYRVPILRGDVKIDISGKIIDQNNIETIYKDNYCKTDIEKKMSDEFFSFLKKTSDSSLKEYKLTINTGNPTNINKSELTENLKHLYNKGEILKILIPVEIKKYKVKDGRKTEEVEPIESFFHVYAKKYSDTGEQYKFCETVRGNMPIVGTRIKCSSHFLTDIQDDEMKLLVKTGEVANHTKIKPTHNKYKSRYKEFSQEDPIIFINNIFFSLQNLFTDDSGDLDYNTTLDLCSVISSSDFDKEKEGLQIKKGDSEDQEDIEDNTIKIKLPPIPKKLKAYIAKEIRDTKSVGWNAKGVQYTEQQILDFENQANKYLEEAKVRLKQPNIENKDIQDINMGVEKAKNRLKDYENFRKKGYSFFPIKITIWAAFDDGSSDPYSSYVHTDFDFNNKNIFKYNVNGNLEIKSHNQNKIVIDIEDENFDFSLSGFGTESEEKILIHHEYRGI